MIFIFSPIIFGEISKMTIQNLVNDSVEYFSQTQREILKNFNPFFKNPFIKNEKE